MSEQSLHRYQKDTKEDEMRASRKLQKAETPVRESEVLVAQAEAA